MAALPVTGIVEVPADDLEHIIRLLHQPVGRRRCRCGRHAADRPALASHVEYMVREAMAGRVLP